MALPAQPKGMSSGRTRKNSVTISSALALSPALISSLRCSTSDSATEREREREREEAGDIQPRDTDIREKDRERKRRL